MPGCTVTTVDVRGSTKHYNNTHRGDRYICDGCRREYSSRAGITQHQTPVRIAAGCASHTFIRGTVQPMMPIMPAVVDVPADGSDRVDPPALIGGPSHALLPDVQLPATEGLWCTLCDGRSLAPTLFVNAAAAVAHIQTVHAQYQLDIVEYRDVEYLAIDEVEEPAVVEEPLVVEEPEAVAQPEVLDVPIFDEDIEYVVDRDV